MFFNQHLAQASVIIVKRADWIGASHGLDYVNNRAYKYKANPVKYWNSETVCLTWYNRFTITILLHNSIPPMLKAWFI